MAVCTRNMPATVFTTHGTSGYAILRVALQSGCKVHDTADHRATACGRPLVAPLAAALARFLPCLIHSMDALQVAPASASSDTLLHLLLRANRRSEGLCWWLLVNSEIKATWLGGFHWMWNPSWVLEGRRVGAQPSCLKEAI